MRRILAAHCLIGYLSGYPESQQAANAIGNVGFYAVGGVIHLPFSYRRVAESVYVMSISTGNDLES